MKKFLLFLLISFSTSLFAVTPAPDGDYGNGNNHGVTLHVNLYQKD